MNPQDVARSYDQLAAYWAGPSFDRSNGIAQHLRALQFISDKGRALDVGCGASGRIIDLLISREIEVEGLDLSSEMLRLARLRHPDVRFHQADVCTWSPPRTYDFISAWDSIWHVPLPLQRAALLKLCMALSPRGVIIFSAGGLDQPGEKEDESMGVRMYHATLGVTEILRVLYEAGCVCRHFEYDQYPELHVYFIAQRI